MGRSTYARRKERGQELVEFALILPLLLLLLVGIFEFGYVVFAQNTLSNAVREGARYGAVKPAETEKITERGKGLTSGLVEDAITWSVSWWDPPGCVVEEGDDLEKCWVSTYPGDWPPRVRVQAEYEHTLFTGFLWQAFGGNSVTLEASSSMGIER
ncbi:MAG: TadE/TadG family type IV pilus assembly protein [Anaerolineae bacterium]|jgi:hypothetical protein